MPAANSMRGKKLADETAFYAVVGVLPGSCADAAPTTHCCSDLAFFA
jgi:hypothetical protein